MYERIGMVTSNNKGESMKIIDYYSSSDIYVKFLDEHGAVIHTTFTNFKRGEILNPYRPSYYGKGYLGEGFKPTRSDKSMSCWRNMLRRCYNEKFLELHPTYVDCHVCDEWLNFQNFHVWYNDNFYVFENMEMCLDKDILSKGNKLYSPDNCIFVPQFINKLFTTRTNDRGDQPIGVHMERGKFVAEYSVYDFENKSSKIQRIGVYDTSLEAFIAYKDMKELYIKAVAKKFENKLPEKLITAMKEYKVDIDD